MLRTYGSIPCWRIVFSTFRRCMSFYTTWDRRGHVPTADECLLLGEERKCPGDSPAPLFLEVEVLRHGLHRGGLWRGALGISSPIGVLLPIVRFQTLPGGARRLSTRGE